MRDYMSFKIQNYLSQIEDLKQQEKNFKEARGSENRLRRKDAEQRADTIRKALLENLPSATIYEFLNVTAPDKMAENLRTKWLERNRKVDCLRELSKDWAQGSAYYQQVFEAPKIDVRILPAYSFVIQCTFVLAQPYISRDEQDFYIIDNPVRKDKVFGLPYVAPTSWKGSLRAALSRVKSIAENKTAREEILSRMFGNEKGELDQDKFHAGRLFFYPTFFTKKSLEIINPQDRKLRSGTNPITIESVPIGSEGIFTLLYVPFDQIEGYTESIRKQATNDLELVMKGLHAMFRVYGFGAKTHSGFGLVEEIVQKALIEVHAKDIQKISESFISFAQLNRDIEKLIQELV